METLFVSATDTNSESPLIGIDHVAVETLFVSATDTNMLLPRFRWKTKTVETLFVSATDTNAWNQAADPAGRAVETLFVSATDTNIAVARKRHHGWVGGNTLRFGQRYQLRVCDEQDTDVEMWKTLFVSATDTNTSFDPVAVLSKVETLFASTIDTNLVRRSDLDNFFTVETLFVSATDTNSFGAPQPMRRKHSSSQP